MENKILSHLKFYYPCQNGPVNSRYFNIPIRDEFTRQAYEFSREKDGERVWNISIATALHGELFV